MSEFPYMQFYVSDWTSDPQLSMCSPATRGIWTDALCAMHIAGRAGELSGTTDQLARICRCLPAEMSTAIADLQTTKAADVTIRNSIVTLVCRRMKREHGKRKSCLERVKKHRNGGVTPESPPCNASLTDTRASDSEVRSQKSEQIPEAKASSSAAPAADKSEPGVVIEHFLALCPALPRIREVTESRKTAIRQRWKAANGRGLEWFKELFALTQASDYLTGRNGKWPGCSFDWLMNPANAQKVLEGNYSNERQRPDNTPKNGTHRGPPPVDMSKPITEF